MAKILLAEDDDSLRGFLVNALKRAGHAVKDFDEGRGGRLRWLTCGALRCDP